MPLPSQASELSANYGGPFEDYHPVEDPTTDLGADKLNQALSDVAAMTHTAPHAWCSFTGETYVSGSMVISVVDHDAMWGTNVSVKPSIAQIGAGQYVVTWPTTVTDELGETHVTNIRKPRAWAVGTVVSDAHVTTYTANTVTAQGFLLNGSSTADSLDGFTVFVEW